MTKRPSRSTYDFPGRPSRSRLLRLVPASGQVDDLVTAIGQRRSRRIELMSTDTGPGLPSGLWLAFTGYDYVIYPNDASSSERTAIICHELAHMLLGHDSLPLADRIGAMAVLAMPHLEPAMARQLMTRHGYSEAFEADAEELATDLVTQLARNAAMFALRRDAVSDRLR